MLQKPFLGPLCVLCVALFFGTAYAGEEVDGFDVEESPPVLSAGETVAPVWERAFSGLASYYGKTKRFHGRPTASGERFDPALHTAASNLFPLGTWVAVKRRDTGHCTVVRINDRMHAKHRKRVVDLSLAAAKVLDMMAAGVVAVEVIPLTIFSDARPGECPREPLVSSDGSTANLLTN